MSLIRIVNFHINGLLNQINNKDIVHLIYNFKRFPHSTEPNRFVVGILILSLFSGAYMAEIFRGGLAAIPATQRDAARSIGLSPLQTMRFVILPQAIRLVLPPVAGQLVSLIKDSSLLSVIAISEFTLAAQEVNSFTYSTLESYLPLAVGYLLLTLPLSAAGRWLEIRFKFES